MQIEPLLAQIDALASHFGRVTPDLHAIAARGRAEDFRGVMQNTRLVLEAILRDLVTRELKQTVGKAMVDELISKFRQQANAGIIPPNVLAHMGTVQAWGNLGAHDHAGSLADEGVKVGREEVVASLNSMVAILSWYAGKLGVPVEAPAAALGSRPGQRAAVPRGSKAPLGLGVALALVGVAGAGWWLAARREAPAAAPRGAVAPDAFSSLDAAYRSRKEPVPPAGCRQADEAAALSQASDQASLGALHGPEAGYLLARMIYEGGGVPPPQLLQRATACRGFAAAHALLGKVEVREGEGAAKRADAEAANAHYARAAEAFDAALAAAGTYPAARFNRALVALKLNKLDEGVKDLEALTRAEPEMGEAHFYLGIALEAQARGKDLKLAARARDAYCAAFKQGIKLAQARCEAEAR
ncbi:MAG: DUF4145 domain-containing protein [Archangiaceae bacterium]|nr:DUF4145 domain-containing protein [Archangiaceae bacterium]